MGKPVRVSRVDIIEGYFSRVKRYDLQVKDDGTWKTVAAGATIPGRVTISLDTVTTQFIRMNIIESNGAPGIEEIMIVEY
jgi:hypothetical protein